MSLECEINKYPRSLGEYAKQRMPGAMLGGICVLLPRLRKCGFLSSTETKSLEQRTNRIKAIYNPLEINCLFVGPKIELWETSKAEVKVSKC